MNLYMYTCIILFHRFLNAWISDSSSLFQEDHVTCNTVTITLSLGFIIDELRQTDVYTGWSVIIFIATKRKFFLYPYVGYFMYESCQGKISVCDQH